MKRKLFSPKGIFFLPASPVGWLIFVAAIAYTVYVFIDIDRRSHSVSDTLMNFAWNLLIIAALYNIIAVLIQGKGEE